MFHLKFLLRQFIEIAWLIILIFFKRRMSNA